MPDRHRIFRASCILGGLLCALVLAAATMPHRARGFLPLNIQPYGDLFDVSRVADFKVPRTVLRDSAGNVHGIGEAEVIFIGDSFTLRQYGWDFGRVFEEETGIPSYTARFHDRIYDPLALLEEGGLTGGHRAKYLVLEYVDRNLFLAGSRPERAKPPKTVLSVLDRALKPSDEYLVRLVLKNPAAGRLREFRNTFRFRLLGEISDETPVYSLEPPVLYYSLSVDFNRLPKSEEDVDRVAGKVAAIRRELLSRYGIELIFMPVPSKYTACGYRPGSSALNIKAETYDGLLPRLYRKLDARGIVYADLYHDFSASPDVLYYPSDSHWNREGIGVAVEKLRGLMGHDGQAGDSGGGKLSDIPAPYRDKVIAGPVSLEKLKNLR